MIDYPGAGCRSWEFQRRCGAAWVSPGLTPQTEVCATVNRCGTVFSKQHSVISCERISQVTDQNTSVQTRSRKMAPLGFIFAFIGLLLFAYFVRKAGLSEIVAGIRRLGAAFLLILAISSIRHIVRSIAWTKCFEAPYRLRFRDAFAARLMGDALGNIIPLVSIAVAEPSKAGLSVVIFVFSGTTALLLSFQLPKPLRYASIGALAGTSLVACVGYFVVHKQWKFLSGALRFLGRRRTVRAWVEKVLPRAETLEDRIYGFHDRNRGRLLPIFALEVCFHLAGVAEIYTTLWFISDVARPTLLTAFILESVNRMDKMF